MKAFKAPKKSLGNLEPEAAATLISAASDVALVLDSNGVIRDLSFNNEELSLELEGYAKLLGQNWIDTVTVESRPKVESLLREAASKGAPRWRQVNHPSAGGASVPVVALAGSGFPMVPFYFGGFLPIKGGQRRKELLAAAARECTSIYFESPYRVVRMLEDALAEIPQARICLARELTKKFEEFRRGSPAGLLAHFQVHAPRGEFCLVIAPADGKLAAPEE